MHLLQLPPASPIEGVLNELPKTVQQSKAVTKSPLNRISPSDSQTAFE